MDIPMLQIGNISFVPKTFGKCEAKTINVHVCSREEFGIETLSYIEDIAKARLPRKRRCF